MELKDEHEVEVTRSKLKVLEERFEASRREPAENAHLQELSLWSLSRDARLRELIGGVQGGPGTASGVWVTQENEGLPR